MEGLTEKLPAAVEPPLNHQQDWQDNYQTEYRKRATHTQLTRGVCELVTRTSTLITDVPLQRKKERKKYKEHK